MQNFHVLAKIAGEQPQLPPVSHAGAHVLNTQIILTGRDEGGSRDEKKGISPQCKLGPVSVVDGMREQRITTYRYY